MPLPRLLLRPFSTSLTSPTSTASPTSPIDPALLLRLSTVLYQQQAAPLPKFRSHLQKLHFHPTHELFLQLCNQFPYSWRPIHNFLLYSKLAHNFSHSPTTANKALDVYGRALNVDLLHRSLREMAQAGLATVRSLEIAVTHLAASREIKKCVEMFDLGGGSFRNVDVLNRITRTLCARRYVDVAKIVVSKLRTAIPPDETTYGLLVVGLCRAGDLVEAAKVWNKMVDAGMEPGVEAYEEMIVTFFKNNRVEDAMGMFKTMRRRRFCDVGSASYGAVIDWVCKRGRVLCAFMVFAEMLKRGVGVDSSTVGALVYGLLVRRRVREGYKVLRGMEDPNISVYHGLMKGLLRLRKVGEATDILREMVRRGCEPCMHTYVMLLQGHLGRRGRKGRDAAVNFESVFVGGLVKAGRMLQATKYVERMMWGGVEVPRFDYNKFLHCFSNEEGVAMFEEVGRRLKEVGMVDLGEVLVIFGERMATRDRRRRAKVCCLETMEDSQVH